MRQAVFERVPGDSPNKKSLAEQSQLLAEHLMKGEYTKLENEVLQHVWQKVLPDNLCVLERTKDGLEVSLVHEGQTFKQTKSTFQKATEWASRISHFIKKSISEAAKAGKAAMDQKAKLQVLAAASMPMKELAEKGPAASGSALANAKNITRGFLAPTKKKETESGQALPTRVLGLDGVG